MRRGRVQVYCQGMWNERKLILTQGLPKPEDNDYGDVQKECQGLQSLIQVRC